MPMTTQFPQTTPIGIHDGRIVKYTRDATTLIVHVVTWNTQTLEFRFEGVTMVQELLGIEIDLDSFTQDIGGAELDIARSALTEQGNPATDIDAARAFVFRNLDNIPNLTVIAETYSCRIVP
jgi:hypothetical protein